MLVPRAHRGDLRALARAAARVTREHVTIVRGDGRTCVGYAVSKAVGNAVTRNRVRRRLREAVRLGVEPVHMQGTYLVVGRRTVLDAHFPDLEASIREGFRELHERTRSHGVQS